MRLFKLTMPCIAAVAFLLTVGPATGSTMNSRSPKHEVRAVWLTTIGGLDWPHTYARTAAASALQKRELCEILDRLKEANVNTVLFQTRIRGTMIYPSAMEPWDGCLSGQPGLSPGYDALQFAIDECHKRGMELHAWVVTIPIGKWNGMGCQKIRRRHPGLVHRIGDEGYLDPGKPATAEYLAQICREITTNYDVDGIHLDYIRYPENWKPRPEGYIGRSNITRIVRQVYNTVKTEKPWVKVSCSPIGKYSDLALYDSYGWNAYAKVYQDAQSWLREGIMDALFPMLYFRGNQFYPFALDWKENSNGRIISAGLGIYFLSDKEKDWDIEVIKREMNVLRSNGLGHAYFRSKFFTDNTKGVFDFAKDDIDRYPALVPPMTWLSDALPKGPTRLSVKRMADSDRLSWGGAKDMSAGPYLTYNIYASETYPVDIADARNILAANLRDSNATIPLAAEGAFVNYAVTAVDRFGNESLPLCTKPNMPAMVRSTYLSNDGNWLALPDKGKTLDAEFVAIETPQGGLLCTRPYDGPKADISSLPEGVYVLKSLNSKGITHRLGHFIIRRQRGMTTDNKLTSGREDCRWPHFGRDGKPSGL